MEDKIGDIGREPFSSALSARRDEAISILYEDRKMDQFLGGLAYNFRQGRDKNDLKQDLALKILAIGSGIFAVERLRPWLHTAARNLCNNDYRHTQVVRQHHEKCVDENVLSKMHGGAVVLQRPAVKTPEQLMQEHEQGAELADRLDGFLDSLPPDMQTVARLWDEGKLVVEIAEIIGKSTQTVYRLHSEFERALVRRCAAGRGAPDAEQLDEVVEDLSWLALVV